MSVIETKMNFNQINMLKKNINIYRVMYKLTGSSCYGKTALVMAKLYLNELKRRRVANETMTIRFVA